MKYLLLIVPLIAASCVATKQDLMNFRTALDGAISAGEETRGVLEAVGAEVDATIERLEEDEMTAQDWLLTAAGVLTAVTGGGVALRNSTAKRVNIERDNRRKARGEAV